jgi:tagatose-1,6-bisphosphate aldolase
MIANGVLPHTIGLLVTLEETGYAGDSTARISRVAEGLNVAKIKRLGANALKLLIYYHPDSLTAPAMQDLLRQVATDCDTHDIALFLETLCYSVNPECKLTSEERRRVIVETARQLTPLGGDVYKVEFPLDVNAQPDERLWAEACAELDAASSLPWVLLSAGVDHETFARQAQVACKAGASGILAGRSIWKEAASLQGEDRADFLFNKAVERARELHDQCRQFARPFSDFYTGFPTDETWYRDYHSLGR